MPSLREFLVTSSTSACTRSRRAARLSNSPHGVFWNSSPAPWLFQIRFLQYLFLIIPGTIIGDYIVQWMKANNEVNSSWGSGKLTALAVLMVLMNVVVVIGLKWRLVVGTMLAAIVLCDVAWQLAKKPISSSEQFIEKVFRWSVFLLMLGFVFEPYEGGIKKDHATMVQLIDYKRTEPVDCLCGNKLACAACTRFART